MMKLSVYMVTLNEEKRLDRTLKAASQVADEIVVVDCGSTDGTKDIALKYGARFIFHEWETYCAQKSFAEKQCANDWVLMVDADEVLSDDLIAEINKMKEKGTKFNAFKIKICNMFAEDEKPRRFTHTFNALRLYDRHFAFMPPDLFNKDRVKVAKTAAVGQLKGKMHHYCFLDIEQAVAKYNRHSSELLKTLIADKRSFSTFRLAGEFPYQFFKYYFLKRYCFLGKRGFIQAMILANFRFLKIAKWFEWQALNKKKN